MRIGQNRRSETFQIPSSHLITTCATLAAIILFAVLGSFVIPDALGLVGGEAPRSGLATALILNVAITPVRWKRSKELAQAMAAVSEALSQANEASFSFRQEALNERSQVEQKLAVNAESLRGSRGFELRSPVEGVVNDVQVTTIGGFVQAGEKVMEVVPMGDKLLVETRVKPSDIAFIKVGDKLKIDTRTGEYIERVNQ